MTIGNCDGMSGLQWRERVTEMEEKSVINHCGGMGNDQCQHGIGGLTNPGLSIGIARRKGTVKAESAQSRLSLSDG